jgi:hypothetical protein
MFPNFNMWLLYVTFIVFIFYQLKYFLHNLYLPWSHCSLQCITILDTADSGVAGRNAIEHGYATAFLSSAGRSRVMLWCSDPLSKGSEHTSKGLEPE